MFKEKKETMSKGLQELMRMLSHKIESVSKENEFIKCREELGVGTPGKGMLQWYKDHGFSHLHYNGEKTHLIANDGAAQRIQLATDRKKGMK